MNTPSLKVNASILKKRKILEKKNTVLFNLNYNA